MHLIEAYALASGAAIEKCFINEKEINLPSKKYITFHGVNPKGKYRQYDYWQIVIDDLLSHPDFDYEIVQIGEDKDLKYYRVNGDYLGKTNFLTLAFLIKNSELHFGYDSFPVHLASYYDKKIVALYPQYAVNTGPFFNIENDCISIEADPNCKTKPIWSEFHSNDRINSISPKLIVKSILELLQIN